MSMSDFGVDKLKYDDLIATMAVQAPPLSVCS